MGIAAVPRFQGSNNTTLEHPFFRQTNLEDTLSESPTAAGEVGLQESLRDLLNTERVSVELGLNRTSSDAFQVLGYELPQH